jgi:hypothetical protein
MDVNQPRRDDAAFGIDDGCTASVEIRADRIDLAVDDANIERAISGARRVDESAAFD